MNFEFSYLGRNLFQRFFGVSDSYQKADFKTAQQKIWTILKQTEQKTREKSQTALKFNLLLNYLASYNSIALKVNSNN